MEKELRSKPPPTTINDEMKAKIKKFTKSALAAIGVKIDEKKDKDKEKKKKKKK